jgi:transposase InsO family protein
MALAADYPVRLVCRATGWPRSSLYLRAAAPAGEAGLRAALVRLAGEWPTYGYRRLDVFTRGIRGWEMGRSLDGSLTLAALGRALRRGRPEVHHSDQGVQYAASAYTDRLAEAGAAVSMAAVGEPEENGYAERLMRTIKEEEVELSDYEGYADARRQLGRFLDSVYNRKRIHSALGYLTPAEFEQQWLTQQAARPAPP